MPISGKTTGNVRRDGWVTVQQDNYRITYNLNTLLSNYTSLSEDGLLIKSPTRFIGSLKKGTKIIFDTDEKGEITLWAIDSGQLKKSVPDKEKRITLSSQYQVRFGHIKNGPRGDGHFTVEDSKSRLCYDFALSSCGHLGENGATLVVSDKPHIIGVKIKNGFTYFEFENTFDSSQLKKNSKIMFTISDSSNRGVLWAAVEYIL